MSLKHDRIESKIVLNNVSSSPQKVPGSLALPMTAMPQLMATPATMTSATRRTCSAVSEVPTASWARPEQTYSSGRAGGKALTICS